MPSNSKRRVPAPLDATWIEPAAASPRGPGGLLSRTLKERQRVGAGGTGVVHRAFDSRLHREVAKKTLASKLTASQEAFVRFVQEAELTAQLDHPNIVPVHELECDSRGRLYFTMRLVRGRTLASEVRAQHEGDHQPEHVRRHLEVFLKVCDAVAFAHEKGVIHADIKPENIMVGDFGEAYLMDWGNAHVLARPGGARVSYQEQRDPDLARGTPAYAAPEQAAGRGRDIGFHTDVFGLGTVLYFIVTGRAPFWARSRKTRIARASRCEFPAPDTINSSPFVRPLAPVIMKAMALEPGARHGNVLALKTEVERLLRGGAHLAARSYARGALIVKEGDEGDEAFIIEKGACVVSKLESGVERTLRTLGPGDVFGETAVLARCLRTASVRATRRTTVRIVNRALVEEQLGLDSWLGSLVLALAQRFREVDERLSRSKRGG